MGWFSSSTPDPAPESNFDYTSSTYSYNYVNDDGYDVAVYTDAYGNTHTDTPMNTTPKEVAYADRNVHYNGEYMQNPPGVNKGLEKELEDSAVAYELSKGDWGLY